MKLVAILLSILYTALSFKRKGRELYGYGSHWLVYLAQEAKQYKAFVVRSFGNVLTAHRGRGLFVFLGASS